MTNKNLEVLNCYYTSRSIYYFLFCYPFCANFNKILYLIFAAETIFLGYVLKLVFEIFNKIKQVRKETVLNKLITN